MNSEAMSADTQSVIANTAPHAPERQEIVFDSETVRTVIRASTAGDFRDQTRRVCRDRSACSEDRSNRTLRGEGSGYTNR